MKRPLIITHSLEINLKTWDGWSVGNMSTNVCSNFRCAALRINKDLGIFIELIATTRRTTRVAFWDPPSGYNKWIYTRRQKAQSLGATVFIKQMRLQLSLETFLVVCGSQRSRQIVPDSWTGGCDWSFPEPRLCSWHHTCTIKVKVEVGYHLLQRCLRESGSERERVIS